MMGVAWPMGVGGRGGANGGRGLAGIRPETHSPGMFSWFPIFFPLKVRLGAAILDQPIGFNAGGHLGSIHWVPSGAAILNAPIGFNRAALLG